MERHIFHRRRHGLDLEAQTLQMSQEHMHFARPRVTLDK